MMSGIETIDDYHAHVYFDQGSIDQARTLLAELSG